MFPEDPEHLIRKYALQNAVLYKGKANSKAVMGKVLADDPALRPMAKELMPISNRMVEEVNLLSPEEQREMLESIDASLLLREKGDNRTELTELPGAHMGKVAPILRSGTS